MLENYEFLYLGNTNSFLVLGNVSDLVFLHFSSLLRRAEEEKTPYFIKKLCREVYKLLRSILILRGHVSMCVCIRVSWLELIAT